MASIKLNPSCDGRQNEKFSPGSVRVMCITLRNLIQAAYGTFASGPHADPNHLRLLGAPEWAGSSHYDIGLRIQASKEGSCIPLDLNHADQPVPNFCGRMTAKERMGRTSPTTPTG